ncbi:MAG: DUF1730 domain-containing protein [Caldilineaceae bacterium]|nr:DUF1730 domain-containing protein [Caldilineaceae bacterium]
MRPDHSLSALLKSEAGRLGFDFCRIVKVDEAAHAEFFVRWLSLGRAGEMAYLARNLQKRRSPALLAEEGPPFRSLIVLGVDYHRFDLAQEVLDDPARGIIARYAWGEDYHEIIRPLLYELDGWLRVRTGRSTLGKGLVDTGPVLERDWAQQAGIGFTGKNCCTIHPQRGSWVFLATLLVPEALACDPPVEAVRPAELSVEETLAGLPAGGDYGAWQLQENSSAPPVNRESSALESEADSRASSPVTCGHCTRCLDACPTDAFAGPFHLDPQRCISYWTIESRQPIPRRLRRLFGNRIFGCDICQEVCPWNQRLAERTALLKGLEAQQARVAPPLLEGFDRRLPYWLEPGAFAERWRRSPLKRAKRAGMLRNVCVALGNWGDPAAFAGLEAAAADESALARGHAAWGLGELLRRHNDARAASCLESRLVDEAVSWVREEIGIALGRGNETLAASRRREEYNRIAGH